MVEGVLSLKDQLHEYMYRGMEMSKMNLLSFMLDTYDAKMEQGAGVMEEIQAVNENTLVRTYGNIRENAQSTGSLP